MVKPLHDWLPTPTIGTGPHRKDANWNFACQTCGAKVTKQQLINDLVPVVCRRRPRKAA